MTRPPHVLMTTIVLLGALWIARCDGERAGRAAERLRAADSATDATIARLAAEQFEADARHRRQLDSATREVVRLKRRVIPVDTLLVRDSTLPAFVIEQFVARDSVIASQDSVLAAERRARLFWQGQAIAYRDTVIPALETARDAYRKRSERRVFCVGGPSATAGVNGRVSYGLGATCGYRF